LSEKIQKFFAVLRRRVCAAMRDGDDSHWQKHVVATSAFCCRFQNGAYIFSVESSKSSLLQAQAVLYYSPPLLLQPDYLSKIDAPTIPPTRAPLSRVNRSAVRLVSLSALFGSMAHHFPRFNVAQSLFALLSAAHLSLCRRCFEPPS